VSRTAYLRSALRCTLARDWAPARMWLRLFRDSFRPLPF